MYSDQPLYDSDSVTSYNSSTSSPSVDGVIFTENVQEWFQLDQSFNQEVPSDINVYPHEQYWQVDSNGQATSSNYTYIFDTLPAYNGNGQSKPSVDKSGKSKRRRTQTAYQRKAANVRERRRMGTMNTAFDELRQRLPAFEYEKKLSRIETLKLAMTYISFMKDLSEGSDPNNISLCQYQDFKDKVLQNMNEEAKETQNDL
ncbi:protein lin-32-like [Mytilus edulis]|uniref:protein lin-32-like n=1 Tax=Mytilus edulis TaxID=6550 RepID=UPI0039F0B520